MRIATDIGGTFTDLICFDQDKDQKGVPRISVAKTDTTPSNFEEGIFNAIKKGNISISDIEFFTHGTTMVINALTEKKGAKTALITTQGFRDVLEIARCNRPDLFNFNFEKQPPFVPRYLRTEVEERMTYKGEVQTHINLKQIKDLVLFFKKEGVESIAVSLLHAYKNPIHEIAVVEEIKKFWPEVDVVASHTVTREWREYERTSSTVLSAYVSPKAKAYLNLLETQLKAKGLKDSPYIMQSNGGITTVNDVKSNPITMVESGPASGVFGAIALGKVMGKQNLIVLDIGGTTAKCALVENGEVKITTNYKIEHSKTEAGYPIQTPVIDIVEIGNGGGSIAWVDAGGKMHVGPQSAGASPGPAAYGRGGQQLTTTDANVITGRIHPDLFLGGEQKPDLEAIQKASKAICQELGVSLDEVAKGIIRVANANMLNALKLISVSKGYDPRDFAMMVIGGGGAMHGAELSQELKVSELIVPMYSGVFSALGMLMTDLRRDTLRTDVTDLVEDKKTYIQEVFEKMKIEAIENYRADGYTAQEVKFELYADLRYAGQEHYVKVNISEQGMDMQAIAQKFHQAHQKQYTFQLDTKIELVNFHLVAEVEVDKPEFVKPPVEGKSLQDALIGEQEVDFDLQGKHMTPFYDRDKLEPKMVIEGPCIVGETSTTTVVPPNSELRIDEFANLIIQTKN